MQRYRTVIILLLLFVVPLAVAVVAARFLLQEDAAEPVQVEAPSEESVPAAEPQKTVRVLAAVRELPVGALLAEEDLTGLELTDDKVRPGHIVMDGPEAIREIWGHAVREPLPAGAPITRSAVVGPGQRGFLEATLRPGTRAMTIGLGGDMKYSHLIDPGDRVDVILTATLQLADGAPRVFTRTILEDVRVVAVSPRRTGAETAEGGDPQEIRSATLEVSPAQADRLALAEHEGRLSLTVRSLAAVQQTRNETVNLRELVFPPPTVPETLWVLAAARALPAGTLLREEDLSEMELKTEYVQHGHILVDGPEAIHALRGHAVREPLPAGGPLTRSSIVGPGERGFLATVLRPGTRAVTIRPEAGTGHAGPIDPGDRVDVILTGEVPVADGATRAYTRTIIEDVRVVAVSPLVEGGAEAPESGEQAAPTGIATATLEVSPAEADLLAHGGHRGVLSLAVHSLAAMNARPAVKSAEGLQRVGEPKPPGGRISVTMEPVLAPRKTVRIIRGGEVTEQVFADPEGRSSPARALSE
ncbi:MAG: Flp pilus assembly protein CpaB [Rhodospirillales bacterium]|nr:Flp pilus assembly protein CpaB [Rhodospirillales bacterium]